MTSVLPPSITVRIFKTSQKTPTGVVLCYGSDGHVCISRIKFGSLFAGTSLKPGYEVISINGTSCENLNITSAADIIRDAVGTVTVVARETSPPVARVVEVPMKGECSASKGIATAPKAEPEICVEPTVTATAVEIQQPYHQQEQPPPVVTSSSTNYYVPTTPTSMPIYPGPPGVASSSSTNYYAPPSMATSHPPPGVADGGVWGSSANAGEKTWTICVILCLLGGIFTGFGLPALLCPCDEKDAYMANHKVYDANGTYIGQPSEVKFRAFGQRQLPSAVVPAPTGSLSATRTTKTNTLADGRKKIEMGPRRFQ